MTEDGDNVAWDDKPLGIAVVDETIGAAVAIEHVTVGEAGANLSGAWVLSDPNPADLDNLLRQWIIVGTRDGIERICRDLGQSLSSADLRELVSACQEAESAILAAWQTYKDEEPKKRANLVPVGAPAWPRVQDDADAVAIMRDLGRVAVPPGCADEMRDVLALARLVEYVVDAWQELESERLSRPYLAAINPHRAHLPAAWLSANPPYRGPVS
jgi:HPt (histidine-containing phosphotransfer) domain-containing protein